MTEQLPLLEGGILRGEVCCRTDGFRSSFFIDVPPWDTPSSEVKKVWLANDNEGRLLLGTLMPENGRLRLSRTLSQSSLRTAGIPHPTSAQIDPERSDGWQSLCTFSCADPIISACIRALPQGSWRRDGERVRVRFSWRLDMPVPVTALFCLSEVHHDVWYITLPL